MALPFLFFERNQNMKKHSVLLALLAGFLGMQEPGLLSTEVRAQSTPMAGDASKPLRKLKFLLNSGYTGANAWFLLADDRGYFREEGIEIEYIDGRGAFTAAGRMAAEGYDVGYGDMQALIEQAAADPKTSPIGVYMLMDRSPSVVAVPANSKVKTPRDLEKLTITGHTTDVALNTFEQYSKRAGIDGSSVRIAKNDGDWKTLLGVIAEGKADALFGYYSTISVGVRAAGKQVSSEIRFLKYPDTAPELFGNVVMVSPAIARDAELAKRFVNAVNRGVMAAVCQPDEAIAAVTKRNPKSDPVNERGRLVDTVMEDMGGTATLASGVGDTDKARLETVLKATAELRKLPRQPTADEVFTSKFLPEVGQRKVAINTTPCKAL